MIIKEGAEVRVIMTDSAKQFVSPLVISTLSKNRVYSGLIENGEWINHVELGRWADLFLLAQHT
jgi:phosphopantothenoylcysteine decarboxylase/phosphopantothenate--cysteine ligase